MTTEERLRSSFLNVIPIARAVYIDSDSKIPLCSAADRMYERPLDSTF